MKYIVVCYAIHDRCIASTNTFTNWNRAFEFIKKDANSVYNTENDNGNNKNYATIEINDEIAVVTSCNEEYIWTWEIISIAC